MNIWSQLVRSQEFPAIKEYYENHGVLDLRVYCWEIIESDIKLHVMHRENLGEPLYEQNARLFYDKLQRSDQLRTQILQTPRALYDIFLSGMESELRAIRRIEEFTQNNDFYPITTQIYNLNRDAEILRTDQETLNKEFLELQRIQHYGQEVIYARTKDIFDKKSLILSKLDIILQQFNEIQIIVIDQRLKEWQRSQALAGNGGKLDDNLKYIQHCIENLLQIIIKILTIINIQKEIGCVENELQILNNFSTKLKSFLEHIVVSSFIVEKQPPQVMKTNTRFAATVRWLIGSQITVQNTTVECVILSEAQAQRFCQDQNPNSSGFPSPGSSGEIQHNTCNLEYNQQNNVLLGQFRNMQLKKIKRAEKKGTESVMDEKFALLFYTTVVVDSFRVRAWTLSLPVVVIVHGNQEPQSWATITWDNAFSDIGRVPFVVPEQVGWQQLSLALNTKFSSATGRELTIDNLKYLYEKLFHYEMTGDQKGYVTWNQFCKEPLRDRNFTFWEWFYAIIKVTKDHLAMPWKEGKIVGFINRNKVPEVLSPHPVGTFLLRFSDSELGGITVNVKGEGNNNILMLQPWTAKDLAVRSLGLRIRDLHEQRSIPVRYLYLGQFPPATIESAFPPTQEEEPVVVGNNGYIRNRLQVVASPDVPQPQQQQFVPNPDLSVMSFQNSTIMHL